MDEFLDIYRLYAKNFGSGQVEMIWPEEDIEKLKALLDVIGNEIQNGWIIVKILKRSLKRWNDLGDALEPLINIRDSIFEIESLSCFKDRGEKIEPEKKEGKIATQTGRESESMWGDMEIRILEKHFPRHTAEYIHRMMPQKTAYAILKKAEELGIKKIIRHKKKGKVTDTNIARDEMLKSGKQILDEYHEKTEETIEQQEKEEKRMEPEQVKTKLSNPFDDGTAERHLHQIAIKSNWIGFKKGTPLIMVMTRMGRFSKDEIKKAIDTLVKRGKAKRLPNNFIAFSE